MLETTQLTSGEFVKSHGGEHPHDIRFGASEFGYDISRKARRIIEFEPENFHMFTVVSVQTVVRSAPDESFAVLFHHHNTVVRQLLCVRCDLKRIRRCNYAAGHKKAQQLHYGDNDGSSHFVIHGFDGKIIHTAALPGIK